MNDLGARKVVNGADSSLYMPDEPITRAEFATIIVRTLGLTANGSRASFTDVKSADWYYGAVAKASEYGLITGYEEGTFRPSRTITRQEAITVITRAMKLAGLDANISATEVEAALHAFSDRAEVDSWAKSSVAAAVKNGIVMGSYSRIRPTRNMTRAETAKIIRQLLENAKLIAGNR